MNDDKKITITPHIRTMEMRSGPVKMGTPTHEILEVGNPPIPWQPFNQALRHNLNPRILCLWWLPLHGGFDVFTGRVAYWPAQDCAVVRRAHGSTVCVRDGAFFAIVTAPVATPVPRLDDALEVSAPKPEALPASPPPSGESAGA